MKTFIVIVLLLISWILCFYQGFNKGIKETQDYYFKKYQKDSIAVDEVYNRTSKMTKTMDSLKLLYKGKIACDPK